MITKKELDLVEKYARIVSITFSFPFDWKNHSLQPTNSKFKVFIVTMNFLFSLSYLIFLLVRLSPKFGGYTPLSMPFHIFTIACHFVYFFVHLHCFLYTKDTCQLFNQLVHFNYNQGNIYFGFHYLPPNKREKVIQFLHRWINGVAIMIGSIFLIMPSNTYFAYSILPMEWQILPIYLVFLVIEFGIAYKIMIFHLFVILYGFFYIVSTNFWLEKVCIEWSQKPDKGICTTKVYPYLSLLNNLYNKALASLLIPVSKSLVETCLVISLFGTIRLYDQIPPQAYILLPGLSSFLIIEHQFAVDRMSTVHEISKNLKQNHSLRSLSENGLNKKYLDKFFLSCRPLRCQLTNVLFVEKSTKLVLLNMLNNMLVWLLVGGHSNQKE